MYPAIVRVLRLGRAPAGRGVAVIDADGSETTYAAIPNALPIAVELGDRTRVTASDKYYVHVVATLGQAPSFYTATLVPQAATALAAEHAERGRTPILVFDEAHLLDNAQLEAVRMLTNHDMDSGAPFAALLVGQPTLRHRLRLGVLAALDQRISVRYALAGMTATETADYITHHVKIAGRADTLFSTDAITLIHNASRGYPRAINNLAVNALTSAFARNSTIVDEKAARIAISETGAD